MTNGYQLKDSGHRQVFDSGAQRDREVGKGRYDLISPLMLKRLADVLEKGSIKYSSRNWELGMPMSRCIDSASRHIHQYLEGQREEDHLTQGLCNLMFAIHIEEQIMRGNLPKELNDLPNYLPKDNNGSGV